MSKAQSRESIRNKRLRRARELVFCYFMLAVPVSLFGVFWVYVNINSILMAFKLYDYFGNYTWSLVNFKRAFIEFFSPYSSIFSYLKNTMLFFPVTVFIQLPLTIFLTFFIYKKIVGFKFFRLMMFIPAIVPATILAAIFKGFISAAGPMGAIQFAFGKTPILFLNDENYAMATVLFYTVWYGFAGSMLLFSGAMSRIPTEVIESARLDGASLFREFWSMTVPLIWPTINTVIMINIAALFTASGPVMLLTQGQFGTKTISFYIYEAVRPGLVRDFAYPSAIGLIFTTAGVPLIMLSRWLGGRINRGIEY